MWFSVKMPRRVEERLYVPCVAYEVTEGMKSTVLDWVKRGWATSYEKEPHFCNGKLVAKAKVKPTETRSTETPVQFVKQGNKKQQ